MKSLMDSIFAAVCQAGQNSAATLTQKFDPAERRTRAVTIDKNGVNLDALTAMYAGWETPIRLRQSNIS
jgi:hypothetical protein